MRTRKFLLIISISLSLAFVASAQNPFETPGESYTIELESGWNTISIPASSQGYRIGLNNLLETDGVRCELEHGEKAFTYEGKGKSSSVIEAQRGYAVYVENTNGCSMEFDKSQLSYPDSYSSNEVEGIEVDEGWKVVSTPREMSLSQYKKEILPECNLADPVDPDVEAYQIDPNTFENIPLSDSDSMNPGNVYWIKTNSDCSMEMNDYIGSDSSEDTGSETEEDSNSAEDSSEGLTDPTGDWEGWSYEGAVEPDRHGVNDAGELVLKHSGCGKVYYEKEYDEGENIVFDISFEAQDWTGMAGAWYTYSTGDLAVAPASIEPSDIEDSGSVQKELEVEVTQDKEGPVQVGFSADITACGDLGNAKMTVEMK